MRAAARKACENHDEGCSAPAARNLLRRLLSTKKRPGMQSNNTAQRRPPLPTSKGEPLRPPAPLSSPRAQLLRTCGKKRTFSRIFCQGLHRPAKALDPLAFHDTGPLPPPARTPRMMMRKPSLVIGNRRKFSKVRPSSRAPSIPWISPRPRIAASCPPARCRTPKWRGLRPCLYPRTWSSSRGECDRFARRAGWLIRRRCRNLEKLSSGALKRWQRRFFQVSGHYLRYFDVSGRLNLVHGP